MRDELLGVIRKRGLGLYSKPLLSTSTKSKDDFRLFMTRDARGVHAKLLRFLSAEFSFLSTIYLWNAFSLTRDNKKILSRQEFFKGLGKVPNNSFLKELRKGRSFWKPKYGVVVVTEDEGTYVKLSKLGCPVQILFNENDLLSLESYDLVQVVDCDNFKGVLERLPQTVFLSSIDEAYLERFLELLSSWRDNLEVLKSNEVNSQINALVHKLSPLMPLLNDEVFEKLSLQGVNERIDEINEGISQALKGLNVSGSTLFSMMSQGRMPPEVSQIITSQIKISKLPPHILVEGIPVKLDEGEFELLVRKQDAQEFTGVAERIRKFSELLQEVPQILEELSEELLLFDFISGVSKYLSKASSYPTISESSLVIAS